MNTRPLALGVTALAIASPLAPTIVRDHYARQRIPRMQRELDQLHADIVELRAETAGLREESARHDAMILRIGRCTSSVVPVRVTTSAITVAYHGGNAAIPLGAVGVNGCGPLGG